MEEAHSSAYAMHQGNTKKKKKKKKKNVSYPKGILKVEGYKERCCRIYFQMSHLSKS